jgi:membrane protease YdiL (CAAX protease family)
MRPIVNPSIPKNVTDSRAGLLGKILRGPNGYRAFWRLSLFAAIFLGFVYTAHYLFHFPLGMVEITPRLVAIVDGGGFLMAVAAALVMARLEKRSLAEYGLPVQGAFGPRFLEGIVWGIVSQCATLGIICAAGSARIHGTDTHGAAALYNALAWGASFVLVGMSEEFQFRGYTQFTIATGIGFWPAAFVLSGMFWVSHMANPAETWIGGLTTFFASMAYCVSLRLTGDLWFAIGLHAGWDWTETYLFGVADSGFPAPGHLLHTTMAGSKWMTGGSVGPEGSIIEIVIALTVIALIYLRFRHFSIPRNSDVLRTVVHPVV